MSRVCSLLISGLLLIACSGTETIKPVNLPPTISFTMDKIAVKKGVPVDLSVSIGDPNADDQLMVTWLITSGTLE